MTPSRTISFLLALLALTLPIADLTPGVFAQGGVHMTVLGELDEYQEYSDIWGYTDEFGNEYALMGSFSGTSVINVTDPANPVETGYFPGPSTFWRDIKTYGDYAYVVTEGSGGGLVIIDLTDPDNPTLGPTFFGGSYDTAHNIYIEEATGRAYLCGANEIVMDVPRTLILDVATNPLAPVVLGSHTTRYIHDLYVRNNIAYVAEIADNTFSIFDWSNPATPNVLLAGPQSYPGSDTHNTWLTDDGNTMITSDEQAGASVRFWDITNLGSIPEVASYRSDAPNVILHNVLVNGDFAYVSYYSEGVHVLDVTDPTLPVRAAWEDTFIGGNGGFNGAWGVYPYLPSGNILVSDIERGLLVLNVDSDLGKVRGVVTEMGIGTLLDNATVELVEGPQSVVTGTPGRYGMIDGAGTYTLNATREGFIDFQTTVALTVGGDLTVDIAMERLPNADITGVVEAEQGNKVLAPSGLGDATIELVGTGFSTVSGPTGDYTLPQVTLGNYAMRVSRPGFGSREFNINVVDGANVRDIELFPSAVYETFDADANFTVSGTATTGIWERVVPLGSGGGAVQPDVDATLGASNGICYVTGNASSAGANIGENDVDGGTTILLSSIIDMSGLSDPYVRYARWYVNSAGGSPGQDIFRVNISNDGGSNWFTLESTNSDIKPWTRVDFRVTDTLPPTNNMQIRFIAEDAGAGSIVEAAIDDFEVYGNNTAPTGVGDTTPTSRAPLQLLAAPNPFNPRTELSFTLSSPSRVALDIYDARGRHVANILTERLPAGDHRPAWNGTDGSGNVVASGVYMAMLRTDTERSVRKLTLTK